MSEFWFDFDPAVQAATHTTATTARVPDNSLGRDAFLKLLVTQMQYQDPLNPMDNSQMLSQMAQFSALEQMHNVSNTTLQSMAFSMIGKVVEGTIDSSTGGTNSVVGVVSSILVQGGKTFLQVNDSLLDASRVTNVYTDPVNTINHNVANNQSFNMIGKVIQAITINAEMEPSGFVEGKVDFVKFASNGGTILVIGDKEVFPSEVVQVGNENMLIGRMLYVDLPNEDSDGTSLTLNPVTGVVIRNGRAYVQAGGRDHHIERINHITDALTFAPNGDNEGREVRCPISGVTGNVTGIVIRDGEPFFRLGELTGVNEVSYKLIRGIFD